METDREAFAKLDASLAGGETKKGRSLRQIANNKETLSRRVDRAEAAEAD